MAFNQDTQDMINNRPDMWDEMYYIFFDIFNTGKDEGYRFTPEFYKWVIDKFLLRVSKLYFPYFIKVFLYQSYSPTTQEFLYFIYNVLDNEKIKTVHDAVYASVRELIAERNITYNFGPEITSLIITNSSFFETQVGYYGALQLLRDTHNRNGIDLNEYKNLSELAQKLFLKFLVSDEEIQFIHYTDANLLYWAIDLEREGLTYCELHPEFFRKICEAKHITKDEIFTILTTTNDKSGIYFWAQAHPEAILTDEEIKIYSQFISLTHPEVVALLSKEQIIEFNILPNKCTHNTKLTTQDILELPIMDKYTLIQKGYLGKDLMDNRYITEEEIMANMDMFDPSELNQFHFYISEENWKKLNSHHGRRQRYNAQIRSEFVQIFGSAYWKSNFDIDIFDYLTKKCKDYNNANMIKKIKITSLKNIKNKELRDKFIVLQNLYK